MKHLPFYLMLVFFLCMACGEEQGDRALVKGTIKGLGNDTLIVYGADQMFDKVDTIYVKKGKFSRFITVDTLAQTWLLFKDGSTVPLYLNKRSTITIKGDTTHLQRLQIEDKGENHLLTQFTTAHDTTLTLALVDTFITHHPTSTVGFYLINRYLLGASTADRQLVKPLLEKLDDELKHHLQYLSITDRLEKEARADTGSAVTYFRLRDINNSYVSRADFTKKWLLINFWATWNQNSQRQNRTLYKPVYQELKKEKIDDFVLWGISLDIDRQAWREAVRRDTLEWYQSCDGRGWLTEPAKLLDLRNLPTNILISPDGKIAAYNLTREQIEDKIKELKEKKEKEKEKKK